MAVVVALRLAGIGTPPPEVNAAPPDDAVDEAGPLGVPSTWALGGIVADFDVAPFAPATTRCLEAGPRCGPDDVLDVDTTRARLEALAATLGRANDPEDRTYVGRTDATTTELVAATRRAAAAAADALAAFLSTGCAGSIDGVLVDQPPASCDSTIADARRAVSEAAKAVGEWSVAK